MSAKQEFEAILIAEVSSRDPVAIRVLRDERLKLQTAMQHGARDPEALREQTAEARRVRLMWVQS